MKLHHTLLLSAASFFTLNPASVQAQLPLVNEVLSNPQNEPAPVHPVPAPRQLKWQETEFYAFFHYGMNTYTNKEWGFGNEDVNMFAPTAKPDPMQWLTAAKSAGMKGGIAVVKHHDGFCLWDTETTDHKCTSSNNEFARQTNIPRDFADAAKQLDLKYGFYISPWDRNSAHYGTDTYVKDVFLRQCAELAKYGTDQFEMWFDGANGGDGYYGGKGGIRNIDRETYYDVPNLRDTVHKVCPACVLWGVGGEARWIGNEEGYSGETIWSPENRGFAPESNGTRGTIDGWFWLPGESDAKITNRGWFWHEGESVLSCERLFQMYLETIGRNATLILNLPPDRSGSLPEATVQRLNELGAMLCTRLGNNLAPKAKVTASEVRKAGKKRNFKARNVIDGKKNTYWATNDAHNNGSLTFTWRKPQALRYVVLQEHIRLGQRVKSFVIETSMDGKQWTRQGGEVKTTTIGYKRIIPLNGSTKNSYTDPVQAKYLRVTITDSKACPTIENVEIY